MAKLEIPERTPEEQAKLDAKRDAALKNPRWIGGYARVSTKEQNVDRQIDAIHSFVKSRWGEEGVEALSFGDIYEEKMSGAKLSDRPVFTSIMKHLHAGDIVVAHSVDRVARNNGDFNYIMEYFRANGAALIFLKHPDLDPSTANGKLMLSMLSIFAEFERDLIKERQRAGIAAAQRRGKYKQRTLNTEQLNYAKEQVEAGTPKAQIARELGVSRPSLYRYLDGSTLPSDAPNPE